jgi:type I restriction enzyme S subunit
MMEKQTKIGTVCSNFDTFQLKSVLVKNDAGDWGSEPDKDAIGVIRSTNFNNDGKLDLSDIAYRTLSKRKFEEKKLYASDILIERSGGSETQPVGRVGFITDEIAETDYAFANFIQRISLNDNVNAKFVYYCLQQMYEMGITAGMQSQTTGIRNLDWKQYIKILLPKPILYEQSAIAAMLSKVDEAIAAVQGSIAAAERLKKSLMQNLLTGRMKPDGTLRKEDEFYVDEKFGRVPLGWEVKKVTEVADYVQYGLNQASSEKGKIPMLRMNNIVKGKMTNAPLVYVELNDSLLQQYKLEKGDILFNRTNSLDLVGKVGVFELDGDYVFASYLIKVKVSKDNNPYFVNYALNSYPIQCSLRSKATPAVSQANINSKSLRNTSIIIPTNKKEQDEIVSRINNVENEIINKQNKIAVLERLKKSLMQNLLTGRVRVKDNKY